MKLLFSNDGALLNKQQTRGLDGSFKGDINNDFAR
jgi:hypothetical protein